MKLVLGDGVERQMSEKKKKMVKKGKGKLLFKMTNKH